MLSHIAPLFNIEQERLVNWNAKEKWVVRYFDVFSITIKISPKSIHVFLEQKFSRLLAYQQILFFENNYIEQEITNIIRITKLLCIEYKILQF